jgi:hypothetical protein
VEDVEIKSGLILKRSLKSRPFFNVVVHGNFALLYLRLNLSMLIYLMLCREMVRSCTAGEI